MKKDIKGLWRFYDEANSISGIVVGDNKYEAIANAVEYLKEYFGKGRRYEYDFREPEMIVWQVDEDADYSNKAIAIAY